VTLLRALIAFVLLLNGLTMPPATAMHTAGGAASHTGHVSPEPAQDASHHHESGHIAGGNCCENTSCDCGCAVPQAVPLVALLPHDFSRTTFPEFTFIVKSFHSSPLSAPFRPPA
jgi:hypothetical protein